MNNSHSCLLDLAALQKYIASGHSVSYRYFNGSSQNAGGCLGDEVFSQLYKSRFEIDGHIYYWAEQWMMAGKARLFNDEACLQKILRAQSPQECKQFGREVVNYRDDLWIANRFDLVVKGNVAKFDQNEDLKKHLLETGAEVLVYAAREDAIWGIGLDRDDLQVLDPSHWRGLNLLGFALASARQHLRLNSEV